MPVKTLFTQNSAPHLAACPVTSVFLHMSCHLWSWNVTHGVREKQQSAELHCLGVHQCVSKGDPDRDPHGWDTWGMRGSWLETSIENWFWSLQLYGKEVHMCQCFLSVLACSKFLDNEISVVSELVMTWNSLMPHSMRILLHFCVPVLCPKTVTLQAVRAGATAALLALSICFLSPKSLRVPPEFPVCKLISQTARGISISVGLCQHCH